VNAFTDDVVEEEDNDNYLFGDGVEEEGDQEEDAVDMNFYTAPLMDF
jgi:hypothetical protein